MTKDQVIEKAGSKGNSQPKFVSESHKRAIEMTTESATAAASGNRQEAADIQQKAEAIARSMGQGGRYEQNPFKEKENPSLHEEYRKAHLMKMDREMDILAKEADVSHGM